MVAGAGWISPAVATGAGDKDHVYVNGSSVGPAGAVALHVGTHPEDWDHSAVRVVAASADGTPGAGHGADRIRCVRSEGSRLIVGLDTRRVVVDTETGSFTVSSGEGCGWVKGARLEGFGEYVVMPRSRPHLPPATCARWPTNGGGWSRALCA